MSTTYSCTKDKFDLKKHKETYTNYFETVILENGNIEYAIPSHQEYLIKLACEIKSCSRDELNALVPKEYYCDFLRWLCEETGAIACWTYGIQGKPNKKQIAVLKILKMNGIYEGAIPKD